MVKTENKNVVKSPLRRFESSTVVGSSFLSTAPLNYLQRKRVWNHMKEKCVSKLAKIIFFFLKIDFTRKVIFKYLLTKNGNMYIWQFRWGDIIFKI